MISSSSVAEPTPEALGINAQIPESVLSQNDPNLLLKLVLQIMLKLLDDIANTQNDDLASSTAITTLAADATSLIYGYPIYGLLPTLTPQDIAVGIQQGEAAMFILWNDSSVIQLSPTAQGALYITLEKMVNELKAI